MIDSSRQVIRWSIPGWVLVFVLSLLNIIENIWIYGSLSAAIRYSLFSNLGSGAAAVLVLSGVPLGFLLTQFYYAFFWNWMPLRIAGTDRGGQALRKISEPARIMISKYHEVTDTTEMYTLAPRTAYYIIPNLLFGFNHHRLKSRTLKKVYRDAKKVNFEAIRFYLTLVSTEEGLSQFKEEYTNLSDIYHCIGASMTAVVGAAGMFVVYHLLPFVPNKGGIIKTLGWNWPFLMVVRPMAFVELIIPLCITVLVVLPMFRALQKTRKTTRVAAQAILESAVCWHADPDTKAASNAPNHTLDSL